MKIDHVLEVDEGSGLSKEQAALYIADSILIDSRYARVFSVTYSPLSNTCEVEFMNTYSHSDGWEYKKFKVIVEEKNE